MKTAWKILTVLFFLCVYHVWLNPLHILTKGDWTFYFKETLSQIRIAYFSLWSVDGELGRFLLDVAQAPSYATAGYLAHLGLDWSVIERLVYMWPIITVGPIGMYILLRKYFSNEYACLTGVIVFSFNTYTLALQTGHLTLATALALLPVVFFFFSNAVENGKLNQSIYAGLSASVMLSYEPRMAYIVIFILFFYFIWTLIAQTHFSLRHLIRTSFYAAVPVFLLGILNVYWVLAFKHTENVIDGSILERSLWGGNYYDVGRAMTLFHPWWTGSEMAIFQLQPTPIWFYIVPIIAFSSIAVTRKRIVIFAAFIACLGILFAKQEVSPFPNLYLWMFKHFPGFAAFREASKFYSLIVFSYSILFTAFFDALWLRAGSHAQKIVFATINILAVGIFLVNALPLVTGNINSLFVPRTIPNDYIIYKQFIDKQNEDFRVLFVPATPRWASSDKRHLNLNLIGMNDSKWSKFLPYDSLNPTDPERILATLKLSISEQLLNISSVKYVVVPISDLGNSDDIFIDYGKRNDPLIRDWYIRELSKLPYLQIVNIGTRDLVVFQNTSKQNTVFSFKNLYRVDTNINIDEKLAASNASSTQFFFTSADLNFTPNVLIKDVFESMDVSDLSSRGVSSRVSALPLMQKGVSHLVYIGAEPLPGELRLNNSAVPQMTNFSLSQTGVYSNFSLSSVPVDFRYYDPAFDYSQHFTGGDFATGPWQKIVGDCNSYDSSPDISMRVEHLKSSTTSSAIVLEARKHIACTSQRLAVNGGSNYLLSFDYQSPNTNLASFHIGFDDTHQTAIYRSLNLRDKNWNHFANVFMTPASTTMLTFDIYARESNGVDINTNKYSNFSLIEVPDIQKKFYVVTDFGKDLHTPYIAYERVRPSKYTVHVSGAKTSFYVAFSQSYHPQWTAVLNNERITVAHGDISPFANPDAVPAKYHFELNDFINGWYVDPVELCGDVAHLKSGCTLNNDGSYNIEIILEFWPQRWLYLGSLISIFSAIIIFCYFFYRCTRRAIQMIYSI